jgi:branched-chain amino acid transport system permease protein
MAVIGGLYRLEGAWVGAFVYVVLNNYLQTVGFIGPRFDTVVGIVFLVIVLASPAGLMGIWERALGLVGGSEPGGESPPPIGTTPVSADL